MSPHTIRVAASRAPAPRATLAVAALPRVPVARRALVGAAWALAWTLAWAFALMVFANKARAEPLSLAVSDGPVSLPIYVAQSRGFFKAAGVDVKLRPCRSGRECYGLLADGQVDLATASELLVAVGSAARPDIAILATISASSYQIRLVARRSAGIAEEPQMRGKRIGTVMGTSAQYFLDNWLVYNDIDPKTVHIVPLAPDRIAAALAHRDVDAIAIWEPLASATAAALGGDAVVFSSARVYTQHFSLLTDRGALARRERDMTRLLSALIQAQRFIAAQPGDAQAILAAQLGVTPAQAVAYVADQDYRIRLDQSLVTTMQGEARWAARGNMPGAEGDLLHAIEPGPLRAAAPEAVGLVH